MINKTYYILFAFLFITLSLWSMGNDTITSKVHELKEVVVTSETQINKGGYEILLLTNKNRNYGTNALDAVSSLNRFITSLNETKLLSWDRAEVYILINGIPSSATELRSFKGADIKNVEYYPVAPPQYMSFTNGPVINVVMKKRHDRLYSGYFNTSNAVTTGFGTNQADLSYTDSLNQVKVGYFVDYRDINKISSQSEYDYTPFWSTAYKNDDKYKSQYHSFSGSYQHYRTNQLFNARLSFVYQPSDETSKGDIFSTVGNNQQTSSNNSSLSTNYKSAALDLYYNYILRNGSLFAINIVNTLGSSSSESDIDSPINGKVNSLVKNKSYSFVANTFFASRALGGNYTIGSRYEYKQLDQEFEGNHTKPYSHNEFINAGISWSRNGMSLVPAVGLNILSQSDGYKTNTSVLPYFRVYADWWGKGTLKGFTTQLTLLSRQKSPSLGLLTDSYNFKDYHYIATGNPDLKNFRESTAKLSIAYFFPKRKDQIILIAQTGYIDNAIGSILEAHDGEAFIRPFNLNHTFNTRFDLYGSWYPFSWLEISPYLEFYLYNYRATSKVRTSYFRYGGNIAATFGNVSIVLNANSPTKDFDGDLITKGSMQFAATIQYKYQNWSFGAKYNFSGHNNCTYGAIDDFKVSELVDWKPLHYLVRLTATYSFSIGKSRSHGRKILNESGNPDSGLNKYNTPTEPK